MFPRELFIWQSLMLIQQNMLLILPCRQLRAKWRTLSGRLAHLGDEAAYASLKRRLDDIAKELGECERCSEADDRALRHEMVEFRKSLDDRLVLDLWRTVSIRRYGIIFSLSAFACIALLIVLFACSECSNSSNEHWQRPIAMVVAGFLGGLLSGIATMRYGEQGVRPPLASVEVVRPVIGGIAGLFLFLIAEAQVLNIADPGLFALAIAFGFTELAFYRTLYRIASNVEDRLGKSFAATEDRPS